MNFLAHAYLAADSDHAIVGSLMGDFVKGPLGDRYGAELTRALLLHRRIDTYTDAHDVVRQSRHRVSPARRRFAGVLVDVFYDHFLARHWEAYCDVPLERFTARVYALLYEHYALLPERLQAIATRMAASDWLASYRRVEAVGSALDRIGARLKRGNALLRSAEELLAQYDAFQADFAAFFPDVVRFARGQQE
ncbi:MAG TPA: ACP phosphodiesterase [Burkholderiales bacterium]|nr:ACP phosphodiesterase [Burkholderiales bacterium]